MFKIKVGNLIVLTLIWAAFNACSRTPDIPGDPKQRLLEYVNRSFAVKTVDDKSQLLGYLTGEVKRRLESWSAEQFQQAFLSSKRVLHKISVREIKPISEGEVQITYELIYNELKQDDNGERVEVKITNKKLCQMLRGERGLWYIGDVKNIKEIIEFQNGISIP